MNDIITIQWDRTDGVLVLHADFPPDLDIEQTHLFLAAELHGRKQQKVLTAEPLRLRCAEKLINAQEIFHEIQQQNN